MSNERKHTGRIGIHTPKGVLAHARFQAGVDSTRELVDELIAWVVADPNRLSEFRTHVGRNRCP